MAKRPLDLRILWALRQISSKLVVISWRQEDNVHSRSDWNEDLPEIGRITQIISTLLP